MSEPVELPALDESPEEWIDGEEALAEAAREPDPEAIAASEAAGADLTDWTE